MEVLNQMDEDLKDKLRKKEILTYSRRKKVQAPPPPTTKEVHPPPPPPVHDLLPQPAPSDEELHLNIDVSPMMGKMNMSVPMVEMCKIPYVTKNVLKALRVQDEARDPPVILNTMYHGNQGEESPPFYLSLGINGFHLDNCMIDYGASTNVMSIKVLKQLGLKTTHPYGNVCGIDSRKVKVYALIEYVEVHLQAFPHMSLTMNIIVIGVPDAWGMLLSRSWSTTLWGFSFFFQYGPYSCTYPYGRRDI
jgi:hypothetical protein